VFWIDNVRVSVLYSFALWACFGWWVGCLYVLGCFRSL